MGDYTLYERAGLVPLLMFVITRPIVVLTAALLAACSTLSPSSPDPQAVLALWQDRQVALARVTDWEVTGRVALKHDNDGWSGTLKWHMRPGGDDMSFHAPLGQGSVLLHSDERGAVLTLPDKQVLRAEDGATLLHQHFGWRLPLRDLRAWVMGRPHDASNAHTQLDHRGRLAWLEQSGWRVEYQGYTSIHGLELPDKISLHAGNTRVRLKIDGWKVGLDPEKS